MGVTIKQIAEIAGVSRGTVDRVIHNRYGVDPKVKDKVEKIMKELNYKPNVVAQALKQSERSLHFGYIIPDVDNPFWEEIIHGFHDAEVAYESYGVRLTQVNMKEISAQEQLRCLQELVAMNVDGLFIPGMNSDQVTLFVNQLPKSLPVITFNTDIKNSSRLCFVGQNHFEAGKVAGRMMAMLLQKEGEVVAFSGRQRTLAHLERFRGFCVSMKELRPEITIKGPVLHLESNEKAYSLAKQILTDPNIAGLYVTGEGAAGVAKALRESDRRPEVKMICYDTIPDIVEDIKEDVIDLTIGQEAYMQGYLPVKLMYEYITYGTAPARNRFYTDIDIRVKENIDYKSFTSLLYLGSRE